MTVLEAVARAQLGRSPFSGSTQRAVAVAVLEHVRDNITPEMVAAGWGELKRARMPKLGPGPGVVECFRAMIDEAIKEIG